MWWNSSALTQSTPTSTFGVVALLFFHCANGIDNCIVAAIARFTFVYIRQLAIHVRTVLKATNPAAAIKTVYNWQFIHCLKLWTEVLCVSTLREQKIASGVAPSSGAQKSAQQTSLEPLLYPLTQVLLATANLMPAAQSFPLLLHCVEMLNKLSLVMKQYIPVFPVLISMLNSSFLVPQTPAQQKAAESGRGSKGGKGNSKALSTLNLGVTLRLGAAALSRCVHCAYFSHVELRLSTRFVCLLHLCSPI